MGGALSWSIPACTPGCIIITLAVAVAVAEAVAVAGGGGKTWKILFFHFLTTYAENDKDYKGFLSGRVPKRVRFRVRPL